MKLYFRGARHEDNPPMLEVREGEISNKNRSHPGSFPYVRHIPVPPPMLHLSERHLNCNTRATPVDEHTLADQTVVTESDKKWQLAKNFKTTPDEVDKTHQANIRRSMEYQMQVAKADGDKNLFCLLEDRSKQVTYCAYN